MRRTQRICTLLSSTNYRQIIYPLSLLVILSCSSSDDSDVADSLGSEKEMDQNSDSDDEDDHSSGDSDPSLTHEESDSTEDDEDEDPGSDDESISPDAKFDLNVPDLEFDPNECDEYEEECNCTAVDLLFVVDNSVSMQTHQASLAQAFPQFVDAIVAALDPGVNVHIGVTSTEMGYASLGMVSGCMGLGTDGMYITPDNSPSDRPAAQGRLATVAGKSYAEFNTDDPQSVLDDAAAWFAEAATLGTSGSNVEMAAAAAGWAADPANDAVNGGFIRDEGAVLGVFFVQDEPDQTPQSVGGQAMLDKLIARKTQCGGASCIIGGGLVNQGCLTSVPLGDFFDKMGTPAVVEQIPNLQGGANPEPYITILKGTLAGVIEKACDSIQPPK